MAVIVIELVYIEDSDSDDSAATLDYKPDRHTCRPPWTLIYTVISVGCLESACHGANCRVRICCTQLEPENNSTQSVQLGSRYFHGKGVK